MNIRIGDQVKYLNDVGGGEVVSIRDKKFAVVLQDDGFEIPVLLSECLKIESDSPQKTVLKKPEDQSPQKSYDYEEIKSPEGEQMNLILAFLPDNSTSFDYADMDLYLVNDSNYFCQYSCGTLKNNQASLLDHGVIEPNTKLLIESFEKRNLLTYKEIWFNGQFFKVDKPFDKKPSVEYIIKLKAEKFEQKRFSSNDFFDMDAVLYHIIENDFYKGLKQLSNSDIEDAKREKDLKPAKRNRIQPAKNAIIEIDLHIQELLDNVTGLSNADILNYQMSKFRETLENYKNKRGQKIVFIHGIGNGTLKTELRKSLDRMKIKHQDASFKEYGFGATMVIL